jgi:ribosomal-protein-serine acetyltransferase
LNLAVETSVGSAEIGFWIDAAAEGQGVVSRALNAVLGHAFGDLGLHRVEMRTLTTNDRSHRLAERFGFSLEGVLRRAVRFPNGHRDVAVTPCSPTSSPRQRRGRRFSSLNLLI